MFDLRRDLAAELAIDPCPQLGVLHEAVLRADPRLAWSGQPNNPPPGIPQLDGAYPGAAASGRPGQPPGRPKTACKSRPEKASRHQSPDSQNRIT